jgi:predicted ABC-type ATPase
LGRLVLLVVLATQSLATHAASEQAECQFTGRAQEALLRQEDVRETLLKEIDDHRYEDCSRSTECYSHVAELANVINDADGVLLSDCSSYTKWRYGIDGLIDPRVESNGTLHQYADDSDRHALHDRVVDNALSAAVPNQQELSVIMTMGAPGSGKSYVLNHLGMCKQDIVMIDPDEFKQSLVEYQGAIAADDALAADRVHRESSMLSKRARDQAIASRRNMCIDGVLSKRQSAIDLINRLHDAGYEITLVAISIPFEVAYNRVVARGEETGRFVPYEFARQAHANIETHSDEMLRMVDHGYIYDTNDVYGAPPRLIAEYQQGEITNE